MNILFNDELLPNQKTLDLIAEGAKICLQEEGIDESKAEISISFVCTEEIKELNNMYRNKDSVTDVLSFPQFESVDDIDFEDEVICLGDVVICPDIALIQAEEFGHSPEREFVYLAVHSVLHLLGYDHMEEEDKEIMRRKEEAVMMKMGLER